MHHCLPALYLYSDLLNLQPGSDVILCGDMNGRTGHLIDYIPEVKGSMGELCNLIEHDSDIVRLLTETGNLHRNSKDTQVNNYGTKLIDLCKSTGLVMINGRIGSDRGIGGFTRIAETGCSVVDYALCNARLFRHIQQFDIEPKLPESDHRGLGISLSCNIPPLPIEGENVKTHKWLPLKKYKWDSENLKNIPQCVSKAKGLDVYHELRKSLSQCAESSNVAELFDKYMQSAFSEACPDASTTRAPRKAHGAASEATALTPPSQEKEEAPKAMAP